MTWAVALVLAAAPWSSLSAPQRQEAIAALKPLPMPERVARASDGFVGTAYALSPLGEGQGQDPDPLLRYDAVDCVTLVEESMALALAPDDTAVVPTLNDIRYAGAPSYETRNHVMEAQWLPENVRRGYLKDVTRAFGGAATRKATKVISAETWKEKSGKALGLAESAQPKGTFALELIPAREAVQALSKAPSGLVVVVARADRPWLVTRISHVGVLIQSEKGPLLRHASRSFKRVVDEPLERYLSRNLDYGAWTIEGLAVYEPLAR
ncbi:MAG: N-acetylmuramoyl-L-alanine amidase-like domain-containing protein [Myxococcota bacterium]